MNWTWQDAVVLAVVMLTIGAFVWSHHRRKRNRFASASGCGCGASSSGSKVSVTYRARRGERPQVIVRGG